MWSASDQYGLALESTTIVKFVVFSGQTWQSAFKLVA
jgi:hypothetical protein